MKKYISLVLISFLSTMAIGQVNLDSNLIGYWPLNGNMVDESVNSNNGINFNCSLTSDNNGILDNAYEFDGSTSYIELPSSYTGLTLPFSISAWVKKTELNVYEHIFSSSSGANNYEGLYLGVNPSGNVQISYGDGDLAGSGSRRTKATNSSIPIDEWVCIAVVVNGPNDMLIYVNSVDQGGTYSGTGGNLMNGQGNAMIGRALHNMNYWSGMIDEVRLYNRALTSDELDQICNPEKNDVSVSELNNETRFDLYPNPVTNIMNLDHVESFNTYAIVDLQGRMVQTGVIESNDTQLNVSNLLSGNYILRLKGDNTVSQTMFTVSH